MNHIIDGFLLLSVSDEGGNEPEMHNPFKEAIRAGVGGMMVGHLQVPVIEPIGGLPSSLSRSAGAPSRAPAGCSPAAPGRTIARTSFC